MRAFFLFLASFLCCFNCNGYDDFASLPAAYNGRIRAVEAVSALWYYDFYHGKASNNDLMWDVFFFGHSPWDDKPLFWIKDTNEKEKLKLDSHQNRFSYNELKRAEGEISQKLKLWESYQGSAAKLDDNLPLKQRLQQAGQLLLMLPSKYDPNVWYSLHALNVKVFDPASHSHVWTPNFTRYPESAFNKIRTAYIALEQAMLDHQTSNIAPLRLELANALREGYKSIQGKPYAKLNGKELAYPTLFQLEAEMWYYKLPWISTLIGLYAIACLCLVLNGSFFNPGLGLMIAAFALHSFVLGLRCFILARPPVSNMFETVLYVPWIAVLLSLILWKLQKNRWLLTGAGLVSLILLSTVSLSDLSENMDPVQAVLDSQYWLIIHVLMIVGSYGVFALSGILGHLYLIQWLRDPSNPSLSGLSRSVTHTMYIGLALLIPGTILGGVWAAQSWGRFWDWDPKESWAFITACTYLIWVHLHHFRRISDFGMAVGSIVGLVAVSFTWYGVNYILGTGLHSYGFGSGSELPYYLYLASELIFLIYCLTKHHLKSRFSL